MKDPSVCVALDIFSALLLVILLATCYYEPLSKTSKAVNRFRFFILIVMLAVVADLEKCFLSISGEHPVLYTNLIYFGFAMCSIVVAFGFSYVVALIREKTTVRKQLSYVVYGLMGLLALMFLVPGVREQLIVVAPGEGYTKGPMFIVALIVMLLGLVCFKYMILSNHKVLGIGDTLILCIMDTAPLLGILNGFWPGIPSIQATVFMTLLVNNMTYQRRIKEAAETQSAFAQKELELTNARVNLMVSQIQPHFLYNTLNSIAGLCAYDPQTAQKVTSNFSDYLRGNLDAINGTDLVPFEKELEHTRIYTDIEQVRFGSRLKLKLDIFTKDFQLPPLTVQPLVENAIKHGIMKKREGGTVTIRSFEISDGYCVAVVDDGIGFNMSDVEKEGRTHLGVALVRDRLTEQIVREMLPDCEFFAFSFADDYLDALKKQPCDIAFMDVEMPGMTGIELARESAKYAPKVNMIFLTGYPNYTGEAMDLFASGYVLKPLTAPKLQEQLDHLRYPPDEGVIHKLIRVRCFGFFEAFVGTVPIHFGREKTRELLAYFVLQRGIPVDAVQIRRALWGLDGLDPKSNSYFHHLKKDLAQSLEAVGAGEVLRVSWNNYAIDTARVECDWYMELEKNPKSSKARVGPFMKQYPWAKNMLLKL